MENLILTLLDSMTGRNTIKFLTGILVLIFIASFGLNSIATAANHAR